MRLTVVSVVYSFMLCSALAGEPSTPILFYANLSADEESATVVSPGIGRADLSLERSTQRLSWKIEFSKLTSRVTGVSIHGPQRPGTDGFAQFDAGANGLALPLTGSAILNDAQLDYLLSGRMYVNVRTAKYPVGEVRGQIQRVPPPGYDGER